jgi:hypothetical protein
MYFSKMLDTYHAQSSLCFHQRINFSSYPHLKAAKVTKKGNSSDPKLPFLSLLALC